MTTTKTRPRVNYKIRVTVNQKNEIWSLKTHVCDCVTRDSKCLLSNVHSCQFGNNWFQKIPLWFRVSLEFFHPITSTFSWHHTLLLNACILIHCATKPYWRTHFLCYQNSPFTTIQALQPPKTFKWFMAQLKISWEIQYCHLNNT